MKTVKSSVYSATAIGISWVGDLLLITEPCFTKRYAWQSQLLSNRDCNFISIYHAALTVNMSTPLWIKHLCECHYVDCFSCYNVLRLALRAVWSRCFGAAQTMHSHKCDHVKFLLAHTQKWSQSRALQMQHLIYISTNALYQAQVYFILHFIQ